RDKKTNEIIYITHDFEKGYTTAFGGNHIANLDDHPRIVYGGSSAAGAYQVMPDTWDDFQYASKKTKYKIDSFSREDQDKFSVLLMIHHPGCSDLLKLLLSGQTENSIRGRGSRIWASLPEEGDNSRYLFKGKPQPVTPMKTVLEHYEKFLKDELKDESPLHLNKGFLKDFDITCNCGNENSSFWHHPLDKMELRGWYGSGFYPGDSDHGNAPDARKKSHDGLDLYAPIGTTLYACIDGEVYEDYVSGTYGSTLGIKGTYKGTTYYFFYAHLSERSVVKGATVSAGDIIGKTGQTGNASGQAAKMDHLHFEVRNTGERTGGKLNPLTTIDELNTDVITNPDQNTQTGN
ncbi:peptidoglycan DD-metalloendopeptidase family protein, partial [Flavobacterium sp.]|uniref:M23 family metallopeptidase n=1 Tax=Flavobacterium sp. TaxID=239 RepID=UPI00286B544C